MQLVDTIAMAPPNKARPLSKSDGKSEVPGSDKEPEKELPTLCWLVSKVWQSDQVDHTCWAWESREGRVHQGKAR